MDVQVEHQPGHAALLTVKVSPEQSLNSKKKAAARLSQKYKIPGFRPGKAPYHIISNYLGEGAIIEEALEDIGNSVYQQALLESKIDPAAPGEIHKVDQDQESGAMILSFLIPKEPEVDLRDYRQVRHELNIEAVSEEAVEKALIDLQEREATTEEVQRPAEEGDEIELDLRLTWWHVGSHDHDDEDHDDDDDHDDDEGHDDDDDDHDDDDDDHDDDDDDHDDDEGHEHVLIDDRAFKIALRPDGHERDLFPHFSALFIGKEASEERHLLNLTLPEDFEDQNLAGQPLNIQAIIKAVRSRTLPALDDDFAKLVSQGEQNTLEELRAKTREDLETTARKNAEGTLFNEVLEKIILGAEVAFNEATVEQYTDRVMSMMDRILQQQMGMRLDDFVRLTNQDMGVLRHSRREDALSLMRQDVVVLALVRQEGLKVDMSDIEAEINQMLVRSFGEQAENFRKMLDTPNTRQDIMERLLNERLIQRVVAIATGQAPDLSTINAAEAASETAE